VIERSRNHHKKITKKTMPGYMYILLCADGTYYTGSTYQLDVRLAQHQSGVGANYTSKRLPVELIYYEEYAHVALAYKREKQVQGWSRKKKEALMSGNHDSLHDFAECKNVSHFKNYKKTQNNDKNLN
jgi:putative endonuclease